MTTPDGDKTTRRPTRDGEPTIKVSFWSFPSEVHERMKDMAEGEPVYEIYSRALRRLRQDHGRGWYIKVLHPPSEAGNRNVWLLKDAHQDMMFLSDKLDCSYSTVCYTAAIRYIERQNGGTQ